MVICKHRSIAGPVIPGAVEKGRSIRFILNGNSKVIWTQHSVTLGPELNDKGVTLYVNFSTTLYVHVKSSDIREFLYN